MKKHFVIKSLIYLIAMLLSIGCKDRIEVIKQNEKDINNDAKKEDCSEKIKKIYQDSFEEIKQSKRDTDD